MKAVAVRVRTCSSSSNLRSRTLYAVEVRYADGSKEEVKKRYRNFATFLEELKAQEVEGFEDFKFPAKSEIFSMPNKEKRRARFDELVKLALALAEETLIKWLFQEDLDDDPARPSEMSLEDPSVGGAFKAITSPSENGPTGSFKEHMDGEDSRAGEVRGAGASTSRRQIQQREQLESMQHEIRDLRFQTSVLQRKLRRHELAEALWVTIDDFGVSEGAAFGDRHVEYVVHVTSGFEPSFQRTVRRRFREFLALHTELHSDLPLPSKSFFFTTTQSFLRQRAVGLELFLQQVIRLYDICRNPCLQIFLDVHDEFVQPADGKAGDLERNSYSPSSPTAPMYDIDFRRNPSTVSPGMFQHSGGLMRQQQQQPAASSPGAW